jgi:hypothetical protein
LKPAFPPDHRFDQTGVEIVFPRHLDDQRIEPPIIGPIFQLAEDLDWFTRLNRELRHTRRTLEEKEQRDFEQ